MTLTLRQTPSVTMLENNIKILLAMSKTVKQIGLSGFGCATGLAERKPKAGVTKADQHRKMILMPSCMEPSFSLGPP